MKTQTELLYEAYNSVYLTEEDQYCYDIAEFLVSEGFSEEEIYALTEEENFLDTLNYIEEKMTAADYRSLSRHGKKRLRQSGMKLQDPHEYKGAAGKKSREGVQSRRAGRQAWDDATARQKEIARRGRESQQRVRMAQLDAEAEKIYQDSKKKSSTERPPKTAVGRGKEYIATRAQQDTEKLKKAGETIRALASGLFARAQAGEKVKGARVAKGRTVTPEVEKRYKRREGYKAIKKALGEDYFDIVADYLLENFEFESKEHLLQTMTYLDEETIDEIVEGYKGLPKEKMQKKIDSVQNNLIDLYKSNQRPYDPREQTYGDRPNTSQILKNQQRFSKLSNTLSNHNWGDAFGKQLSNKKSGAKKGVRQKMRINPRNNIVPIRRKMNEDCFDIVIEYLLENFEFESEEHLLQTMTYLDEETIDEIISEMI